MSYRDSTPRNPRPATMFGVGPHRYYNWSNSPKPTVDLGMKMEDLTARAPSLSSLSDIKDPSDLIFKCAQDRCKPTSREASRLSPFCDAWFERRCEAVLHFARRLQAILWSSSYCTTHSACSISYDAYRSSSSTASRTPEASILYAWKSGSCRNIGRAAERLST
jgi:hypothetical protein